MVVIAKHSSVVGPSLPKRQNGLASTVERRYSYTGKTSMLELWSSNYDAKRDRCFVLNEFHNDKEKPRNTPKRKQIVASVTDYGTRRTGVLYG
jgi:hypothetical protein